MPGLRSQVSRPAPRKREERRGLLLAQRLKEPSMRQGAGSRGPGHGRLACGIGMKRRAPPPPPAPLGSQVGRSCWGP